MFEKHITKQIDHTPENIMAVVIDIESYPIFLNFITHTNVLRKTKNKDGSETIEADIALKYKFFKIKRKCTIEVDHKAGEIQIHNTASGKFIGKIENGWKFERNSDNSTNINFYILMDVKTNILNQLLTRKTNKITEMIITAFITRTNKLYKN